MSKIICAHIYVLLISRIQKKLLFPLIWSFSTDFYDPRNFSSLKAIFDISNDQWRVNDLKLLKKSLKPQFYLLNIAILWMKMSLSTDEKFHLMIRHLLFHKIFSIQMGWNVENYVRLILYDTIYEKYKKI